MLVYQVLVALFLGVGNFRFPSTSLHDSLGSENGVFVLVVTIDMILVHDQMGIFDIPPAVSITDVWNVPRRMVDGTGNELTNLD